MRARGMRGLAAQRQRAVRVAVERRAIADQVVDAGRGFARHQIDDRRIAEPGAGRDRVGGMALPAVAFADRGGDAALRPGAGARHAGPRARQHQRRAWARASAR